MAQTKIPSLLIYADSESDPDMRYFSGFRVPDPFVAFSLGKRSYGLLNALEFGRAKKESRFDTVLPLERYQAKALKPGEPGPAKLPDVIAALAEDKGIKSFTVPTNFPAKLFAALTARGLNLTFPETEFLPSREIKTAAEVEQLRLGNRCSAAGIGAAEKMLREATIKGRKLFHGGKVLTSERLHTAIEIACLEAGGMAMGTIAAGGDQACDPHCVGSGPLRANELIIVDVFPRLKSSGFHGDMTRTFLRGEASDAQCSLIEAVRAAHKQAIPRVRAGVNGRDVHLSCVAEFERRGFETKRTKDGAVGFFHGTGHGLGLAVHENPRVSGGVDYRLPENSVVTVEPGLYYPGLGGARVEDVVLVQKGAPKLLSRYSYEWRLG